MRPRHGAPAPLRRTLAVARKEVRQLVRDQLTMGFVEFARTRPRWMRPMPRTPTYES